MNFTDFTPDQQELLLACETPEEAKALLLSGELQLSDEILEEIAGGKSFSITEIWEMLVGQSH